MFNSVCFNICDFVFILDTIRRRHGTSDKGLTNDDILKEMGQAAFANAMDEDGGAVERKKLTAIKKVAVAKHLRGEEIDQ